MLGTHGILKKYLKVLKILTSSVLISVLSIVCRDSTINPNSPGGRDISYVRLYNNQWEIFTNNIAGSNPKNITNWEYTDKDPKWSPDGKYIGFSRENAIGDLDLYLFNIEADTLIGLLTSDTIITDFRLWMPNGKIVYYSKDQNEQTGVYYLIETDGSNRRQIYGFPTFFYFDSYNYLYANESNIYLSNLDGISDEFLLDLKTLGKNYINWYDFDPYNDKILILADPTERITNLLVTYSIVNNTIDTISIADSGWLYLRPKFSSHFDKIAIGEVSYNNLSSDSSTIYRILLIENNKKTVLVEFKEEGISLDYRPFAFSPDDRYLAFAKSVLQSGTMVWWKTYIYVIEVQTKHITYIDEGYGPQWNPLAGF